MLDKNGILHCVLNSKTKKTAVSEKAVVSIPRYVLYSKEGRVWQSFISMLGFSEFITSEANAKTAALGESFLNNKHSSKIAKTITGELLEAAQSSDIICFLPPIPFEANDLILKFKENGKTILTVGSDKENFDEASKAFSLPFETVFLAYSAAFKRKEQKSLNQNTNNDKPKIILRGFPFIINDSYINYGLVEKIHEFGFVTDYSENLKSDTVSCSNLKGVITVISESLENGFETEIPSGTPHLVISVDGITNEITLENTLHTFLSSIK